MTLPRSQPERSLASFQQCSTGKEYRILATSASSTTGAEGIGRLISKGSSSSPAPLQPLPFSLRLSWHSYLDHRGIHPATASQFGVGYYAGPGFLRGRIAFPIHDTEGRLVAYAGRSIDGSEPRYLFPRGFRKSQVVFNLHRACKEVAAWPAGCVIVEGFFDCLRVHQAG
jgi:DNA primase catalytic core, N-terminal domain